MSDPRARTRVPEWATIDWYLLTGLCVAAAAFWGWLGFAVHTLQVVGGENDGYTEMAARILEGPLTSDGFHPLGLPLLIVGVASCGLDIFDAGRLVVIAAGILLVASTYLMARRFAGPLLAGLSVVAVAASQHVLLGAVQVCTDVPAAAFLAACLVGWSAAAGPATARRRQLFFGGLFLGLAASMRMPSLTFAIAFLPLWYGVGWWERWRRFAYSGLGGLLGLTAVAVRPPQGNFHQLVWKYRFLGDTKGFVDYMQAPAPIPWSELRGWLVQGCGDVLTYLGRGIGEPWSAGQPWLATIVSLALVLAMVVPIVRADARGTVLACGGLAYTVVLGIVSIPVQRLTVPSVVPAVVLLAALAASSRGRWRALLVAGVAALATIALASAPRHVASFAAMHPHEDLEAVRDLTREHGDWLTIATPAIGFARHVDCFYTELPEVPHPITEPAQAWQWVLSHPTVLAADFLVVGRRTWPKFAEWLRAGMPKDRYRLVRDDAVVVFAPLAALPWYRSCSATLVGDDLVLEIELPPESDPAGLVGVGCLLKDRHGVLHRLSLIPEPDGLFRLRVPNGRALAEGGKPPVPVRLTRDGVLRRGAPVPVRTVPR